MGISFAIAVLVTAGAVAAFTMSETDRDSVLRSPPATLQPRATRLPTQDASQPTSTPGTVESSDSGTPTASEGRSGGDRMMGLAIAEPESTGGTIVIGVNAPPSSLNPLVARDLPVDSVLHAIFEPLVEPHPNTLEPVGALAESWSVDGRGTTWTFRLRSGVTWHDGEPFTAADVVFSYDRYLDPEIGHPASAALESLVTDVRADGDLDVSVTTSEKSADLPVELGVLPIVAAHIFSDVPASELAQHDGSTGDSMAAVTGTGPFKFANRAADGTITVAAFQDYRDGAPALDGIIARPVASQVEMFELLRAVEIDVGTLSPGAVSGFDGLPVRVVDYPLNGFTMLGFNLNSNSTPLFQDVRVRQALLHALDRESMVQDVRSGYGDVEPGTLPLNSWAARPDEISTLYPYDPARSRQLLDETGWTTGLAGVRSRDGRELSFTLLTNSENPIRIAYLEQIREQWSAIGVEVELIVETFFEVEERLTGSGDYEAFLLGYSWDLSPDQSELWSCASGRPAANYTGYCNRAVDNLLVRASRELDPERRAELYLQAQDLVLADLPVAILDFPRGLSGVVARAHNVYPNAVNLYFNAETWWLE